MAKIIFLFFLSYFLIKLIKTFFKVKFYRISGDYPPFKSTQNPVEIDITDKVKVLPPEKEKNDRES
jgi:hypothetical protein